MRQNILKIGASVLAIFICVLSISAPVKGQTSNDAMFKSKIRRHVEKNSIYPADHVRIEFLSPMPEINKKAGNITCNINSRFGERYIGDTSFHVRIYSDGIFIQEETIRVRIEVLKTFVVSGHSIARNTILNEEDLVVQEKWIRKFSINAVSSLEEVIGKNLKMNIRPNTPITKNMLKSVTPVKKGRMVEVVLDNGKMRMLMRGVAEEDGVEDALVKVRNINSNKIIYARVIGPSKVQVDF